MSTKFCSVLHGCVRSIALVAMLCLPFLSVTAFALNAPTNVSVGSLTPTSGTLQWEVTYAAAHEYDIIVSTQQLSSSVLGNASTPCTVTAATPGVVVFVSKVALADVTTYALTGLTEGTHYYLYFRQNGESQYEDNSAWVSYQFSTPCVATSVLPVLADFNEGAFLPSCWMSGAKAPTFSSTVKRGDSGNAMMLAATSAEGCFVYSPVFSSDAHAYYLSAHVYGSAGATYRVGIAAATDLLQVETILEGTIAVGSTWTLIDAAAPAEIRAELEQGVEYVWVIYNAAADGAKSFYVDDVVIDELPTCLAPSALAATSIEANAVTLAWTDRSEASSWLVEYVHGTDTLTATASSNPFTLTGLLPNTSYKIRMKTLCSASDQSAWTPYIAVKTICGVATVPFFEGFESYTASTFPECWDKYVISGPGTTGFQVNVSTGASYVHSGSKSLKLNDMSATTYSLVVLPEFYSETEGALTLSFWMYRTTGTSKLEEGVKVWVNNTPSLEGATPVIHVTRCGGVAADSLKVDPISAAGWYEYEVELPIQGVTYVMLQGISEYGLASYLDDITVKNTPTCRKPSSLLFREATTSTVKLEIRDAEDAAAWEYAVDNTDNPVAVTNNVFTISGLAADSTYTVYVRRVCSADDKSEWVSASVFTTAAPVVAVLEDADGTQVFQGWTALSRTSTYYPTVSAGEGTDGTKAVLFYGADYGPYSGILGMPEISGNLAEYRFVFDAKKTTSDAAGDVLLGFAETLGGNVVYVDSVTPNSSNYTTYTFDLSSYTGAGKFPVLYVRNLQTYLYLDNIALEPVPSCDKPTAVSVVSMTTTQVNVAITDRDANHTAWQVAFGVTGFNPAAADAPIYNVTTKTATIRPTAALVADRSYDVYVRAVCGDDDLSIWTPVKTVKFVDVSAVSNISLNLEEGDHPWEIINDAGTMKLQTTNQSMGSTSCIFSATVVVGEGEESNLSFDYYVSSESGYDYFCLLVDEAATSTNYYPEIGDQGKVSGPDGETGHVSIALTPGTHTIYWRYYKDYSDDGGEDLAQVWNIRFFSSSAWPPTDFSLRAVSSTSASIGWRQCADVVKNEVEFGGQIFETTTDTIGFTNLAPSTVYTTRVRSILANDTTEWSNSFSFRTDCAEFAIPFAEGFEAQGAELCWKAVGNAVTLSTTTSAFDGSKALFVDNDSVAGMLVSPQLDAASLAEYEVSLAINLASKRYQGAIKPLTIGVMTDPNDAGTYIDLGDIVIPSAGSWKEYRFSLADLATPDYADWAGAQYVVVSMSDSATYYFDAFTVAPSADCPKPTALDAQPEGEDVVVTWVSDAAAHYAEVALGDEVVFAGNVQSPFTPEGLTANTTYKMRVRAICDADSSEWTPWVSFKTPCSFAEIPFSENFEGLTALPDCWSQKQLSFGPGYGFDYGDNCWTIYTSYDSDDSYVHNGSKSLKLQDTNAGTRTLLTLPMLNSESAGALTFSFWVYRNSYDSYVNEGVKVWVNNVPSLEGATPLMHVTRCGSVAGDSLRVPAITTNGWYEYEKVLPISGATYVLLEGISEYGSSTYVDDIRVFATPSCPKPTSLGLNNAEGESVTITWSAGGEENAWELVYQLGNAAADTVVVTDTPGHTVTGLAASTQYTINVLSLRSVCSDTDYSEAISGSFSFKTPCSVEVLPLEENFAAGIGDCWTRYSYTQFTDGVSTANATVTTSGWNRNTNVFSDGGVKVNVWGTGCQYWLVSPMFRVTSAEATLAFDVALTTYGSANAVTAGGQPDDKFIMAISTDGTTWHMADATVWSNEAGAAHSYDNISNTGDHFELSLAPYVGQTVRVAFYGESTESNGDNDLHISNLVITEPVACARPTAVEATEVDTHTATIQITDPEGTAWEYAINDVNAEHVAVANTTFAISGLTPVTNYTVYVRRVCGEGLASEWRSVSFTTIATCEVPAEVYRIEATSTTMKLQIDDSEDASAWEYALGTKDNPVAVSDTIFTITDLTPDTDYTLYLRRVCSDTDKSLWISSSVFTTKAPVDAIRENLDGDDALDGWYTLARTSSSYPYISLGSGVNATDAYYFYGSTPSSYGDAYSGIVVLPEVTGDLTEYRFRVDAKKYTASATGQILLGVADALGAPITYVDSITPNTNTFTTYTMGFTSYTGTGKFPVIYVKNLQTSLYLDNFVVEAIPSCEYPQAVAAGSATATSVDVVITDNDADHTAWEVVVVDHNAAPSTGTPVLINSKVATIAGTFVSGIAYDVYARTVCSESDKSYYTGPATFRYIDYSAVTDLPMEGIGDYPWTIITDAGINKLQSTNQGVNNSTSEMEITVAAPNGVATVSFQYKVSSESSYDYLCLYVDQDNPSTGNYYSGFGQKSGSANGTYSLTLTSGTHKIRWRYYKDGSSAGGTDCAQVWNIQVSIASFFTPSDLGVEDLTSNSATLVWNSSSEATYNEVRVLSAALDTIITTTGNSLELTDLTVNTAYQFLVRSFSETDSTAWSAAYRFTTLCVAQALPFSENFDDITSVPSCWTNVHQAGASTVRWSISTGSAYISYQSAGNVALLATPLLSFEAGKTYRIMFSTNHTLSDDYDDETPIYLAASSVGEPVVELCNIVNGGEIPSGAYDHYYVYTPESDIDLMLCFKRIFDNDYGFYVDNIVIEEVPACDKPRDFTAAVLSATQLAVSITDVLESHVAWQVAVGPTGFNPDAADAFIADVDSKLAFVELTTPLEDGVRYDVYVRSVCGENEYSVWTDAKSVKYTDVSSVSNITLNLGDGEYPWELVEDEGILKLQSTNQGVPSTVCDMTATVVVREGEHGNLSFNYFGSGESYDTYWYDYLCFYIDEADPSLYNYNYVTDFAVAGKAGTPEGVGGTYTVSLEPGMHTLRWRFRKDGSGDDGEDQGQVWNIVFVSTTVVMGDTIFDTTCAGSAYEGHDFNISADELTAGYHTFQFTKHATSEMESDTVKILNLFVSQPSSIEFTDTVCAHEHYTGYGFDIADVNPLRTTPYVRHLENQYGCDSTVSLTLFVPQTEFAQTVHLCEGDSYTFGDSVVTTSGVYVHTYQSQYGCDSTVTLEIFFHAVASAITANICSGETYAFGDQTLDAAGTYTATFQNAAGCDSVVTLTLNIIEPVVTQIDGVFCEGTAFAGGSISPKFMDLTVEGVYTDTLQSVVTGCDSILVLTLVEEKIQHTTVEGTYSEGKPFVYDGQSYQEAGTFEIVKTTVNGCDSIITLVVTKETGFDNLLIGDLHIAPNPVLVGEEAVIRTDIVFSSDYVLRVYDAVGRLVAETTEQTGRVPAMPVAGIYTVRIAAAGHHYQAKLIVK